MNNRDIAKVGFTVLAAVMSYNFADTIVHAEETSVEPVKETAPVENQDKLTDVIDAVVEDTNVPENTEETDVPKEDEEKLTTKELVGHLRFEPEYLMFQPDNKRGGIIKMMEHLNADIKDVVVFGDDYNDMDMFCPEWFSIAMGNACQDLKDIANYVTDSNVDDGIKNACEHFGWI